MGKKMHLAIILLFLIFWGCAKDKALEKSDGNLIENPSFEKNGHTTYEGWVASDTTLISFLQDTPANTGQWSLKLLPGSTQGNTALTGDADAHITKISGTNTFSLTVWVKNPNAQYPGSVKIGILSGNQITQEQSITTDNITSWKQYAITYTVSTQLSDVIIVRLSAGSVGPVGPSYYAQFDLVELKQNK